MLLPENSRVDYRWFSTSIKGGQTLVLSSVPLPASNSAFLFNFQEILLKGRVSLYSYINSSIQLNCIIVLTKIKKNCDFKNKSTSIFYLPAGIYYWRCFTNPFILKLYRLLIKISINKTSPHRS